MTGTMPAAPESAPAPAPAATPDVIRPAFWRRRYAERCRDGMAERLERISALSLYGDGAASGSARGGAVDAYRWVQENATDAEIAYLGALDRYFLLVYLLRRTDMLGRRRAADEWLYARCREVEAAPDGFLDLWAREHYKLQPMDEPTPTPDGWIAHGDLKPGSEVFGPDGAVCRVVALNDVVHGEDCYEIEFDDGATARAGGRHLWAVERRTRKRIPGAYNKPGPKRRYREVVLMTTSEIAAHVHRPDRRLAVAVAAPLQIPAVDLPIAPYVLGCWLGDGTSSGGSITCADDIWREIEKTDTLGPDKTPKRASQYRRVDKLGARLEALDLLNNKHIPPPYLRASAKQRLDLLQGLMDTDGSCNPRGTATFVNTNAALVEGVVELCNTLGLKPRKRRYIGRYSDEDYPFWQVSFQAYKEPPPFRLARKLRRCKDGSRKNPRRFIVTCRPIPSVPMRCIQVDRPDGLYLTGRSMVPTHNSTIITGAGAIQEILRDPEITIAIFSHSRPIAKGFLRQIKLEFERNAVLGRLYPDILWPQPKRQAPKWSEDDGIVVRRKGNPKEATVEAWGLVDGMPTGKHFQLRIYDDVVTEKSITSAEMVGKTTVAWELSDNLKSGIGRRWHIGTRYNFGDTYGQILGRDVLTERRYPATADGSLDGAPVLFTQAEWDDRKRNQPTTVAAQHLQNPIAGQDQMFKLAWLRPFEVRPRTLNVYILVDPSKGNPDRRTDRTAMAVVGIDANENKYLLDGFRHRMSLDERWRNLRALYRRWSRFSGVQMVRVGYEQYGMATDIEHFQMQMRTDPEGTMFDIEEVNWTRDHTASKTDRVERLVPDVKGARFYLPAVVSHGGRPHAWTVEADKVALRLFAGYSARARRIEGLGEGFRLARPLARRDEAGQAYDLTTVFMDEMAFFPFNQGQDDLIDAAARLYDMAPVAPVIVDEAALEPDVHVDT